MSIDFYQRTVNSLDKDIADLEKKKAAADKKAADEQKKAANVTISKSASASTVKSKMQQIERYQNAALNASAESASLAKKIADKRKKRHETALKLQKEEHTARKEQENYIRKMQQSYEERIRELQHNVLSSSRVETSVIETPLTEYDVFISHAWEDKAAFVDEFVEALVALDIKVWYDKTQIKWGDSMRARIDDGLKKSKFGVVVLSPNYIAEHKYWTKAELDGLFQLESVNGKVLLPIWHNLTKQQVMNYSPIIASKLAMTTATMTAQEIAEELLNLIPKDETEDSNNG